MALQTKSKKDASNKPDLYGYEMKTGGSKTSFGDWGPNYFIFRDEEKFPNLIGKKGRERQKLQNINKDEIFLKAFGVWRKVQHKVDKYGYNRYLLGNESSRLWKKRPAEIRICCNCGF